MRARMEWRREKKWMDEWENGCEISTTLSLSSSSHILSLSLSHTHSHLPSQCTTPDDMSIAERFLDEAAEAAAKVAAAA